MEEIISDVAASAAGIPIGFALGAAFGWWARAVSEAQWRSFWHGQPPSPSLYRDYRRGRVGGKHGVRRRIR